MRSFTSRRFREMYANLPERVKLQSRRAYQLFRRNPSHPSLNFKKVDDENDVYSARIGLGYRALGQIDGAEIVCQRPIAGENACSTTADQGIGALVEQAFGLHRLLPQAAQSAKPLLDDQGVHIDETALGFCPLASRNANRHLVPARRETAQRLPALPGDPARPLIHGGSQLAIDRYFGDAAVGGAGEHVGERAAGENEVDFRTGRIGVTDCM